MFSQKSIKAFKLLFTYIHYSLASLFVLFKYKSLTFVNLSLFLNFVSIFWSEHFYILVKRWRPALKVHILWKSKTQVTSYELRVQMHKLRVPIHEL